jgi:serine/threonine protein kinase
VSLEGKEHPVTITLFNIQKNPNSFAMEKLDSNKYRLFGFQVPNLRIYTPCSAQLMQTYGPSLQTVMDTGNEQLREMIKSPRILLLYLVRILVQLSKLEIIHTDIKPENIVFDHKGALRLTGFESAIGEERETKRNITMPNYFAAEELGYFSKFTKQTDVYAMGVTIFVVLYKMFGGALEEDLLCEKEFKRLPKEYIEYIINDTFGCDEVIKTILKGMLEEYPENRPSPEDLLNFLKKNCPDEDQFVRQEENEKILETIHKYTRNGIKENSQLNEVIKLISIIDNPPMDIIEEVVRAIEDTEIKIMKEVFSELDYDCQDFFIEQLKIFEKTNIISWGTRPTYIDMVDVYKKTSIVDTAFSRRSVKKGYERCIKNALKNPLERQKKDTRKRTFGFEPPSTTLPYTPPPPMFLERLKQTDLKLTQLVTQDIVREE